MTCVEIKSFEEVVLFELQKLLQANVDRRLMFGPVWSTCAAAAINLPGCPPPETKNKFAHRLLNAIENLEGKGLIAVHKSGSLRPRVTHVTATSRGIEYLKGVAFTHQERMGRVV